MGLVTKTIHGGLQLIQGDLTIQGAYGILTGTGASSIGGTLGVAGKLTVTTGGAAITGALTLTGAMTISTTLEVTGNGWVKADMSVGETLVGTSTLTVYGLITVPSGAGYTTGLIIERGTTLSGAVVLSGLSGEGTNPERVIVQDSTTKALSYKNATVVKEASVTFDYTTSGVSQTIITALPALSMIIQVYVQLITSFDDSIENRLQIICQDGQIVNEASILDLSAPRVLEPTTSGVGALPEVIISAGDVYAQFIGSNGDSTTGECKVTIVYIEAV